MQVLHIDYLPSGDEFVSQNVAAFLKQHEGVMRCGHFAVVTQSGEKIAGHAFYALTQVNVGPGVIFEPGGEHFYSYASETAEAHRGKRLSPARWTFFRDWRLTQGLRHPTVAYIALDNLPSLASGVAADSQILGYSAWHAGQRVWCYRSPALRRLGIGFYASRTQEQS